MYRSLIAFGVVLMSASNAFAAHKVQFENQSAWAIQELYLSPTKADQWGPDQLNEHVINKGETFELSGIPTGKYDVRLVDDEGDECILEGVKIVESEKVVINDENLVGCQAATEASEEIEE